MTEEPSSYLAIVLQKDAVCSLLFIKQDLEEQEAEMYSVSQGDISHNIEPDIHKNIT